VVDVRRADGTEGQGCQSSRCRTAVNFVLPLPTAFTTAGSAHVTVSGPEPNLLPKLPDCNDYENSRNCLSSSTIGTDVSGTIGCQRFNPVTYPHRLSKSL